MGYRTWLTFVLPIWAKASANAVMLHVANSFMSYDVVCDAVQCGALLHVWTCMAA